MPKVPVTDNVVPFQGQMPSETDFAMAAAMMHAEGKLISRPMPLAPQRDTQPDVPTDDPRFDNQLDAYFNTKELRGTEAGKWREPIGDSQLGKPSAPKSKRRYEVG